MKKGHVALLFFIEVAEITIAFVDVVKIRTARFVFQDA